MLLRCVDCVCELTNRYPIEQAANQVTSQFCTRTKTLSDRPEIFTLDC